MYNEILPPIIKKQKILEANERTVYQLLELFCKLSDNKPKLYRCTAKPHATLFPKIFILLYLEDLKFMITRCCWRVTKIYLHYVLEQASFKRDFVLMNRKSRQNAKNAIEKDIFKLMNNANFGFDCTNNANNAKFEPIIDEISKISYIKKYYNLFPNKVSNFINSDVLEQQIEQDFQQQIAGVKHDDPFKSARINSTKNQNREDLDALECLKEREKIKEEKTKLDEAFKNKKIKTMIDFDKKECNSIKSIVVKGNTTMDVTSRFIKGKMLMFLKVLLKFFANDLIDIICFPAEEVRRICDQYPIIKCHLYLNLTDTYGCSIFLDFICKKECNIKESESRKLNFEILKQSKIAKRLDISDKFWQQFKMRNEKLRKQMELYEIENIDNANICAIAVNPKEYFEKLKNRPINKKYKGVRRNTPGMNFESYAKLTASTQKKK